MIFNNLPDDTYIAYHFITDFDAEKNEVHLNHKLKILSMMETSDVSRLAFIASKEGDISTQKNLEKEITSRKYRGNTDKIDIDELKSKVDIVDLVESYVGGTRWKRGGLIKCPLPSHNDGTSSFSMNREKGFFVCFGCGKKGSVIDLVMNMEGCTLGEAINKLKPFI